MSRISNPDRPHQYPYVRRRFYAIEKRDDGLIDIYLAPVICHYESGLGYDACEIAIRVVSGIVPYNGLEDDIKRHYNAWWRSGEETDF